MSHALRRVDVDEEALAGMASSSGSIKTSPVKSRGSATESVAWSPRSTRTRTRDGTEGSTSSRELRRQSRSVTSVLLVLPGCRAAIRRIANPAAGATSMPRLPATVSATCADGPRLVDDYQHRTAGNAPGALMAETPSIAALTGMGAVQIGGFRSGVIRWTALRRVVTDAMQRVLDLLRDGVLQPVDPQSWCLLSEVAGGCSSWIGCES